ncbi:MAG TPA: APC family permease [Thermodesulfobacteriota bacterium]|nr:APC family permease [Thermodesulfobacteriota bacterium]
MREIDSLKTSIGSSNRNLFRSMAVAMGLMLSPESLVLLGNSVGTVGLPFMFLLLLAAGAHLSTAFSYGILYRRFPGAGGEARCLSEALGTTTAFVFPICSRFFLALCGITGILATAGYVFNEVFIHSFPNLGFSFCLLTFLFLINLISRRLSEIAQFIFVGLTFLGLLSLAVIGLLHLGNAPSNDWTSPQMTTSVARTVSLGLLPFVGFDLARFAGKEDTLKAEVFSKSTMQGILGAAFLFFLWGLVSAQYVPLERLSDTTVPHMVTARAIWGETGRVWMGVILLASACGASNILLFGVSRMITAMGEERILPAFFTRLPYRPLFPLLLLVTGVAATMGLGAAGSPALNTLIRAGFLFWLLNYAVVHLSILRLRIQGPNWAIPVIGLLASLSGFVGIVATDDHPGFLLKWMSIIFVFASFLGFLWNRLCRGMPRQR